MSQSILPSSDVRLYQWFNEMRDNRLEELYENGCSDFMNWAEDKISVVWYEGCLCNCEPLDFFNPRYDETPKTFLDRVLELVRDSCNQWTTIRRSDQVYPTHVFSFFNDELGEEEIYTTDELLKKYMDSVGRVSYPL